MRLAFVDFESQGVDALVTNPTEVGASFYDVPDLRDPSFNWGAAKIAGLSQLLYEPHYEPQSQEIIDLTGITDEMLKAEGISPIKIFPDQLFPLVAQADYVLAHNRSFDETVFRQTCKRLGLTPPEPKNRWLCTVMDVPWPAKYKCKKLSHLAFDHGIVSDRTKLHRAEFDTDLLAELILTKCDINAIIAYANTPWVTVFINGVKPPWEDGGVSNAQVKKLGYSWERVWGTELVYPKRWVRQVKETMLDAEKKRTPPQFTLTRAPQKEPT